MSALRRCAVALALLLAASAPASAVERIIQFISDVTVLREGELIVVETIRVEAEGNVIRRGIFRDFPTVYRRPDGTRVEVGFHVESVTRNGSTENFALERLSNGIRVRIGSADRTIPRGQHTYVLRYRTTRQIGFFGDYDELYWNVTGTGWVFPIDMAEARITLPEKVPFRQTAIYTGPQDARGKDATIVEQQPGRIVFRTTRPLPPRNGLTVAAAWQKGVVEPPTAAQLALVLAHGQSRAGHRAWAVSLSCSPTTRSPGCGSAAIRRWAPSFRCSLRRTECRPPPRAMSTGCRSTMDASPPPSSISA